ncbi:protein stum homolog isoform X1 [Brachyhypopomus gauderio]|uniref:protein stum homolog isoform X1 n=1 Tax=Brachyhypopomus gauderio TaxID=698409 RepID=UPI0040433A7D
MDQKDTEMSEKGISSSTSGVVVQVREKKGRLRAAIPRMPFPVAVLCLFLNTFVPGLGTFVSAFAVLCGARTDLPDLHVCCVFWLNIAAAFIQILTAVVMVGWIMSIFWGMDMVILAISEGEYIIPTFMSHNVLRLVSNRTLLGLRLPGADSRPTPLKHSPFKPTKVRFFSGEVPLAQMEA